MRLATWKASYRNNEVISKLVNILKKHNWAPNPILCVARHALGQFFLCSGKWVENPFGPPTPLKHKSYKCVVFSLKTTLTADQAASLELPESKPCFINFYFDINFTTYPFLFQILFKFNQPYMNDWITKIYLYHIHIRSFINQFYLSYIRDLRIQIWQFM